MEKPKNAKKPASKKSVRFFWICAGLLIAITVLFAGAVQLEVFSAGPHVVFAMVAGVLATILLGVGLMALAFYSDDSGIDDGNFRDDS